MPSILVFDFNNPFTVLFPIVFFIRSHRKLKIIETKQEVAGEEEITDRTVPAREITHERQPKCLVIKSACAHVSVFLSHRLIKLSGNTER